MRRWARRGGLLVPRYVAAASSQQVLLLRANGADGSNPVDESSYARSYTGAAKISTTQSKYGGSSLKFDATNSYLDFGDSDDWHFGTGDFTLQAWVWVDPSVSGGSMPVLAQFDNSNSSFYLALHPDRSIQFYNFSGPTVALTNLTTASGTYSFSVWNHFAAVRHGNNFYLYLNGVKVAEALSVSGALNNGTAPLRLGKATFMTQLIGYIDDAEITRGLCKYPSGTTFTPPTALPGPDYRYYRINISANWGSTDYTGFAEFDMSTAASNGGSQLLTSSNKTSLSFSSVQGTTANAQDFLTDNAASGTGSKWLAAFGGGLPQWVKMDFGAVTAVRSYTIAVDSDANNIRPKDWTFQGSNDDSSWTTLDVVTGKSWSNNEFFTRDV
jgi:hypothetical protein